LVAFCFIGVEKSFCLWGNHQKTVAQIIVHIAKEPQIEVIPFRRQVLLNAFKLFDLTIISFAYLFAVWVCSRPSVIPSLEQFLSLRISVKDFFLFLFLLLLFHAILNAFGLYRSLRVFSRKREAVYLLEAYAFGTLTLLVAGRLFNSSMITPFFLSVFCATASITAVFSRVVLRWGLDRIRIRGRNLRYILIIGASERAFSLAQLIESKPKLGYRLIGFVNKNGEEIREVRKTGYPLVTDLKGFPSFVRDRVVDEVWIALPGDVVEGKLSRVLNFCRKCGIIIRHFSGSSDPIQDLSEYMSLEGGFAFTRYPGQMRANSLLGKRMIDIVGSLSLLLILSPLLAIVAVFVKATSPGPVIFVQERVGLNRRKFRLYKFRTMVQGAEQRLTELEHLNEISGPVFKIANDPRLTRIGKLLRKTSIDELPQFFNVLKGDMSLVGPRPLPVRDYKGFNRDWYRRRLCVLPGMTCLWQINGRNTIPFEEWMGLDLQYVDQQSLLLDFQILLKTLPAVLRVSEAA